MIRLVALDLDGTLLGHDLALSWRVRATIRAVQAQGVTVTIATGRSYEGAQQYAHTLGLAAPIITCQGALVARQPDGAALYQVTMPVELAYEAVTLARVHGWHVVLYDLHRAYYEEQRATPEFYAQMLHPVMRLVPDLTTCPLEGAVKFVLVDEPHAIPAIEAELRTAFEPRAVIVRSHARFVEGNPVGVSKGAALAWLAEHLGVAQEEVLAVGDADNDVSMLTWAGIGVAMGQGSPAARAAADWRAPSVHEDGVAVALERFVLGTRA